MNDSPIRKTLKSLGLELPSCTVPGGDYTSVSIRGKTAFIAIQFPIWNGVFKYQGVLGNGLGTKAGKEAVELCTLNVLAQIDENIPLEKVKGLGHFDAYYRASPSWDDGPVIADTASKLFLKVLDDKGKHTRGILGVAHLPRNFSVGLTAQWSLA